MTSAAAADDETGSSVRELFAAAEADRRALETSSLPASSPAAVALLDAALVSYARAINQAAAVSLFSPNEAVDDLPTSALPYLLAEHHVAELVLKTPTPPPGGAASRLHVLQRARAAYERFLAVVDGYGLVRPPYDKLLERYRDDAASFKVVAATDAASKREGTIRNYRTEKGLREKLEFLRRDPGYLERGDDEIVREVYLTNITVAIHSTFQSLDSLSRELDILAQAPPPDAFSPSRNGHPSLSPTAAAEDDDNTTRLDTALRRNPLSSHGPLLSQSGKPLQPFTLLGSRADMARGVFRPSHNLPTMSIDEYLEEERRRGNIIDGGGPESGKKPVEDEDDMEIVDRDTYKARAWDDWKDENPRGSGNTMNMG